MNLDETECHDRNHVGLERLVMSGYKVSDTDWMGQAVYHVYCEVEQRRADLAVARNRAVRLVEAFNAYLGSLPGDQRTGKLLRTLRERVDAVSVVTDLGACFIPATEQLPNLPPVRCDHTRDLRVPCHECPEGTPGSEVPALHAAGKLEAK